MTAVRQVLLGGGVDESYPLSDAQFGKPPRKF